jgi:hypothetical protein
VSLPLRTRTVYRTVALLWCKDAGWVPGLISRKRAGIIALHGYAPVAQLDRALVSGRNLAHQTNQVPTKNP